MEQQIPIPGQYWSKLNIIETQEAIKLVRERFEEELSARLHLMKVQAPILVKPETGLNDDLNGVEHAADVYLSKTDTHTQIVQSLAKWKRYALKKYGFAPHSGLYTNMVAIRPDEVPDCLHSVTVDQWDWEKIILKEERILQTLEDAAQEIVNALQRVQYDASIRFPQIRRFIKKEMHTVTSLELEEAYPDLTPAEREVKICKKHQTVLLLQIGNKLKSGTPHDGRAPDYDDWALNGDLLVWCPLLGCPIELSSMGIRVDAAALQAQLKQAGCEEKAKLPFHQMVLENQLPLTMGGGIGQSRVCMLLLEKAHIGEVQATVWPKEMQETCEKNGIHLL